MHPPSKPQRSLMRGVLGTQVEVICLYHLLQPYLNGNLSGLTSTYFFPLPFFTEFFLVRPETHDLVQFDTSQILSIFSLYVDPQHFFLIELSLLYILFILKPTCIFCLSFQEFSEILSFSLLVLSLEPSINYAKSAKRGYTKCIFSSL